jgi:hypothetical protein
MKNSVTCTPAVSVRVWLLVSNATCSSRALNQRIKNASHICRAWTYSIAHLRDGLFACDGVHALDKNCFVWSSIVVVSNVIRTAVLCETIQFTSWHTISGKTFLNYMLYTYVRFCFVPKINPKDPRKSKGCSCFAIDISVQQRKSYLKLWRKYKRKRNKICGICMRELMPLSPTTKSRLRLSWPMSINGQKWAGCAPYTISRSYS